MSLKNIACKKCESKRIKKDPRYYQATVQQISKETGEPIGRSTTYLMFICLDCGSDVYLVLYKITTSPN